ncbi:MAG: glycoside hydrolase family 57 protein [Dissulfurispiraceae bacterium]
MNGALVLLLHAHLPFVRHPEHEYCIEENWLFEAIRETYVPMLDMLERMVNDGISPQLTFSISPTLAEMLNDGLLRKRFVRHMENLIALSEAEVVRTGSSLFGPTAELYNKHFKAVLSLYTGCYGCDLVAAFRQLQDEGHIEIVATAATHAFLPAFEAYPDIVRDQIGIGIKSYIKNFGRDPSGFWLPECGYFKGVDFFLKDAGIRYFFLESHGILLGDPRPEHSIFRPVSAPSGLQVFGRDFKSAGQVWSATEGYPGDPYYRDFYRDIGFDLPAGYLDQFLHSGELKLFTGMKYYRVTGATDAKLPYDRVIAMQRAIEHAAHFRESMESQVQRLCGHGFSPVIFSAFDAELFGHWWFEGICWLDITVRKLFDSRTVRLATPGECNAAYSAGNNIVLHPSSWGEGGYNAVWIGERNHYLYRHLHSMSGRLARLKEKGQSVGRRATLMQRIFNQAAKEMLLAQSSDWPFLIEKDRASEYAERRVCSHIHNFNRLLSMAEGADNDMAMLRELEDRNNLFAWLSPNGLTKAASRRGTP